MRETSRRAVGRADFAHGEEVLMFDMRRREFVALLGGAAAAWPLNARAQQPEKLPTIGFVGSDSPGPYADRLRAFRLGLKSTGFIEGQNVARDRGYAAELVALAPDLILASGTLSVAALRHATRTLPIVFVEVSDPVGAGLVDSLSRPGGNITGFMNFEYSLSGKWLELLKEIAPRLTRAAVLRDSANPAAIGQFGAIQAMAASLGVELRPIDIRDASEIESAVGAFANSANGGLIVTPSASTWVHYDLIIALAARHKLPAVYFSRDNVTGGGLISYGPDLVDQFRRAAQYVDRILKGAKPAELPVQAPTKFELVINLKTAKALGIDVPPSLLARADEVIE
jgi:putative tryptophan/tyrosine transport system substrate-binding protein